jgi:hypothetical protein
VDEEARKNKDMTMKQMLDDLQDKLAAEVDNLRAAREAKAEMSTKMS